MLWFNFVLGSNFISPIAVNNQKQAERKFWHKDKIEPQRDVRLIKLSKKTTSFGTI